MSTVAPPLSGEYVADPEHSSFQFAVKHMKVATYRSSFDEVSATLGGDGESLRLTGRAKVASIQIKDAHFRDHVVDGADFFDAPNHPEITFRSTEIELGESGEVSVAGELTMRGVSRPVTATGTYEAPVEDPIGNTRAALHLSTVVDRRDWGMDWQQGLPKGGDVLGWDVELTIVLALLRKSPA
ncbi:MAG TPA: YceI family protein [Solirubrobacterales bacterium]|nr:YceI family protein [Solirubrobacterales bacterium]